MQFRRLGNTIVVRIGPQSQRDKHRVVMIDYTILIAAVCGFVILRKGQEAVAKHAPGRSRLRREIAKQFSAIVDGPICVPIERQKRIIRTSIGPGSLFLNTVIVQIEVDAV